MSAPIWLPIHQLITGSHQEDRVPDSPDVPTVGGAGADDAVTPKDASVQSTLGGVDSTEKAVEGKLVEPNTPAIKRKLLDVPSQEFFMNARTNQVYTGKDAVKRLHQLTVGVFHGTEAAHRWKLGPDSYQDSWLKALLDGTSMDAKEAWMETELLMTAMEFKDFFDKFKTEFPPIKAVLENAENHDTYIEAASKLTEYAKEWGAPWKKIKENVKRHERAAMLYREEHREQLVGNVRRARVELEDHEQLLATFDADRHINTSALLHGHRALGVYTVATATLDTAIAAKNVYEAKAEKSRNDLLAQKEELRNKMEMELNTATDQNNRQTAQLNRIKELEEEQLLEQKEHSQRMEALRQQKIDAAKKGMLA
mmetsp:Transcript_11925/g.20115  ORF Transcript_11925/g.20115 Transcript_11925/m.20115 type:complete len:368 (+) Transcript_11925:31-1134(+)